MYDPIAVLMEEHQRFLGRLDRFAQEMTRLSSLTRLPAIDVSKIAEFGRFLAMDVDGWHGRKEEEALFPALARYLPTGGGPIEVLLSEHSLLREEQGSIDRSVRKLESDGEALEALRVVEAAERTTRSVLSDHIEKEDRVLFPMARTLLSPAELSEVAARCQEIDSTRGSR